MSAEKTKANENADNRKSQLRSELDELIAEKKGKMVSAGQVDAQEELDRFLGRLHERVDGLLNEHSDNGHDSDTEIIGHAVEEIEHAAFHDEKAANDDFQREINLNIYNIDELNDERASAKGISKVIQASIGIVLVALLGWLLWLAGDQTPSGGKRSVASVNAAGQEHSGTVQAPVAAESKALPAAASSSETALPTGREITVLLSFGNVRSGPSGGADILFNVKRGDVVTELEAKWGWHHIRLADGREGWAYKSLFEAPVVASKAVEPVAEKQAAPQPVAATDQMAEPVAAESTAADTTEEAVVDTEVAPANAERAEAATDPEAEKQP